MRFDSRADRSALAAAVAAAAILLLPAGALAGGHGHHGGQGNPAEHGHGHGQGHGAGCPSAGQRECRLGADPPGCPRGGPGAQAEEAWASDRELFHALLDHREAIRRTVTPLENGVDTVTETDDEALRAALRAHAESMHGRVEDGRGIHLRDPLFAELFRNADRITMRVEPTERGVRVVETSDDPAVAALIRAHAEAVSAFLANGPDEVRRNHAVPRTVPEGP